MGLIITRAQIQRRITIVSEARARALENGNKPGVKAYDAMLAQLYINLSLSDAEAEEPKHQDEADRW